MKCDINKKKAVEIKLILHRSKQSTDGSQIMNIFLLRFALNKRKLKPSSTYIPGLVFNAIFTHGNKISKNIILCSTEDYANSTFLTSHQ